MIISLLLTITGSQNSSKQNKKIIITEYCICYWKHIDSWERRNINKREIGLFVRRPRTKNPPQKKTIKITVVKFTDTDLIYLLVINSGEKKNNKNYIDLFLKKEGKKAKKKKIPPSFITLEKWTCSLQLPLFYGHNNSETLCARLHQHTVNYRGFFFCGGAQTQCQEETVFCWMVTSSSILSFPGGRGPAQKTPWGLNENSHTYCTVRGSMKSDFYCVIVTQC